MDLSHIPHIHPLGAVDVPSGFQLEQIKKMSNLRPLLT